MGQYFVTWQINIEDVDSPKEAAEEALRIQRDETSTATMFIVEDERLDEWAVDLYEGTVTPGRENA